MLKRRGYKTYHAAKSAGIKNILTNIFKFGRKHKWNPPRDFWNKTYRNPYLNKKHLPARTKAPKTKAAIGLLSFLAIMGILLFHPYFNVKQVALSGLEKISTNDLNDLANKILNAKRWRFLNGRNYFLTNTGKIKKEIEAKYSLESLKIKNKFPNKMEIIVKEKQAQLLLENSLAQLNGEPKNHYYLIDKEGAVIQEVNPVDINSANYLNLLMLKFQENRNFSVNEPLIVPATVQFLLFLQEKIPAKTGVKISFVELDQDGGVVNLTTTEGWRIIMDRQNDWDKQMQVLTIFLRDKIKDKRSNLHYIDVRYENRSYYQ